MASSTLLATSDGWRPDFSRPSSIWRPISAMVVSASAGGCRSAGRLRSASWMRVLTQPGPGVVVHDVGGAEGLEGLGGEGVDLVALGHVGGHAEDRRSGVGELLLGVGERTLLDVGEHHLHAFLG